MPQLPIILPVIITGVLVGSLLKSNKPRVPLKKVTAWALVAGVLNGVFAYGEYLLTPQPTFTFRATSFVTQISDVAFTIGSFLTGFLIVIAVFGAAAIYLRLRGAGSETEEPELSAE